MLFSKRSPEVHVKTNVGSMAILSSEHINFHAKSFICQKLTCVCEEIVVCLRRICHTIAIDMSHNKRLLLIGVHKQLPYCDGHILKWFKNKILTQGYSKWFYVLHFIGIVTFACLYIKKCYCDELRR